MPMEDSFEELCLQSLRIAVMSFINIQMLTGNKPALLSIIGKFSKNIKEIIIWDKVNSQPAIGNNILNI